MKNLFSNLILITLLFSIYGCNNGEKTDRDKLNLSDKVKSVRESSYKAVEKFGEIEKGKRERRILWDDDVYIVFNIEGNKIEKTDYPDIAMVTKTIFKYNNSGELIEKNRYTSEEGSLVTKTKYKYNDNQQKIEENVYEPDGSLSSQYIFEYNEDGDVIEEKRSHQGAWEDSKYTYKYDKRGNIIEKNKYKVNGTLERKSTFRYDKNGKKIESKSFNSDGNLLSHWTYKYDDHHNLIERNCHLDERSGLMNYPCDIYSYEYEYNKHGDWIKQIEFINDTPKYVLERIIEYFE